MRVNTSGREGVLPSNDGQLRAASTGDGHDCADSIPLAIVRFAF
jgi:hypothetical protein